LEEYAILPDTLLCAIDGVQVFNSKDVHMYEWLDAFKTWPCVEFTDEKGITHRYHWQNGVPLHGGANAIEVNYFEHQKFKGDVKIGNTQSWVTDIEITKENVEHMTPCL
jgi:hypothetical protein